MMKKIKTLILVLICINVLTTPVYGFDVEEKSMIVDEKNLDDGTDELSANENMNLNNIIYFNQKDEDNKMIKTPKEGTPKYTESDLTLNEITLDDSDGNFRINVSYFCSNNVEFRWLQYDLSSKEWSELTGWQNESSIYWQPKHLGNYWIHVEARDSLGQTKELTYPYAVKGDNLEIEGIDLISKGKYFIAKAVYNSEESNIQFQWKLYDLSNKSWILLSSWQSENEIQWMPANPGDYWLHVEIKNKWGEVYTYTKSVHCDGLETSLNGICVLQDSKKIDMGVAYTTNDDDIKFRWKVYDLENETWKAISDWDSSNWMSWNPSHPGYYWLHVEAQDSSKKIYTYTVNVYFEGIQVSFDGICVLNQIGRIDMGVAYTTNDDDIKFRWKVYDLENKTWELISDWDKSNWTSYKPTHEGYYWLCVEAKTSDNNIKNYICNYYTDNTKITSFKTSIESPYWIDQSIVLEGNYYDVMGIVEKGIYLIYDGVSWRELNSNIWVPQKIGNYLLCYEIIDKNGDIIEQKFQSYSIEEPYIKIHGINVYNLGNFKCSAVANVKTNDRNIEYCWMYYDMTTNQWNRITDWTKSNSISWNPGKEGVFWIHVKVKTHNNLIEEYTLSYYVQKYSDQLNKMINVANNYQSKTSYIAIVDRDAHKVSIMYGRQGNWAPIKYWDCANGKASTPTVAGVFKIQNRGYYFDSGNSRCFWWTQFYGNYLFHTILCNKDGSIQDGRVGIALSHGCVRLEIENAKWIYDNLPRDTTVVVY